MLYATVTRKIEIMSEQSRYRPWLKELLVSVWAIDAFTLQLRLLVKQIEFIEDQISIIEEAINKVMEELHPKGADYRYVLETIPGIGPTSAAAIIGEIGGINRFPAS